MCCGTVNSIKALWETRIKKTKDDLVEGSPALDEKNACLFNTDSGG